MYKVGLTGGIGSGKSRVADILQSWGAAIIDADVIAHELTAAGGGAIAAIREAFGNDMITPEGALNRSRMREHAFHAPESRHRLEAILHPMIASVTQQRANEAQGCYLVFVVPLLVESGRWRNRVDRICVVDCDPETQIRRVQARSGLTRDAIERIMQAQAGRDQRLATADDVIVNTDATSVDELSRQARRLHEQWCAAAQQT